MPPKRFTNKSASAPASTASSPLVNAALVAGAVGLGLWLLVSRGRVSWPPTELLASAYTLAGCLAIVGPVVLSRRESGECGLGDMLWMTGGLLVWVYDLAAVVRGEGRGVAWATPLGTQAMGLTTLAVMLAGWRTRSGSAGWSWTNVTGWLLGAFWVGMGAASFLVTRAGGPSYR